MRCRIFCSIRSASLGGAGSRWRCALLVGLVATVVAVIVWKPVYLAQATVLITSQQIPKDFVRSTVEVDNLANINAMLGEVLSAEKLSKLIDRLGLFPDAAGKAARIDLVNAMRSRIEASPQRTSATRPNARNRSSTRSATRQGLPRKQPT